MKEKAQNPKMKDFSREDEESYSDYISRISQVIFQPTAEEKRQIQRRQEKRAREEAAYWAKRKKEKEKVAS